MKYLPNEKRYDSMKYVRCGRSGLKLPQVSLGLWHNFGSVDVFENAKDIILSAFDMGITHLDLANNYGPAPGSAEENLGKVLAGELKSYRDELVISTKAGYYMWEGPYGEFGSKKYLIASLNQSLKRLGLEYVDIFYSHRYDPETPLEETMMALDQAVKSGKALYAGISNYGPEETKKAVSILNDLGTPLLIHQPKYNMFDRWIEDGLTEVLDAEGVGCIPFSPLAQGMLTDKYINGIPTDSRAAKEHGFLREDAITEEKLLKIRALNDLAQSRGQSLAQMALAWILRLPTVTSVLVGASSVEQLKNNVSALENLKFSDDEFNKIEEILRG